MITKTIVFAGTCVRLAGPFISPCPSATTTPPPQPPAHFTSAAVTLGVSKAASIHVLWGRVEISRAINPENRESLHETERAEQP